MKALKRILLSMFLICSLAVFWACDKKEDAKITEIYFKSGSVPTSVEQYSSWDTDDIVLVVKYSNGTERELNNFNCSGISTQTIGEQTLTATYEGFTCSTVITITQFTGERAYYIEEIYEPNTIGNVWAANSQKTNAYTAQLDKDAASKVKGFVDTGRTYKVGNDNPFKFSPSIQVVYFDESKSGETIHNYPIHADVYLDNQGTWQLISEQDLANYVTIDRDNHTFQFVNNTSVEGKKFKIEVRPDFDLLLDEHDEYLDYEQAIDATKNQFKAISFDFEVVDGYNVYTAKDLSVVDNSNDEGKWTELKTQWGLNDKTTNAVILHNNINITKDYIPSIHFYSSSNPDGLEGDDLAKMDGYMINDDNYVATGIVYKRVIEEGGSFNIEGNYFTISIEELPLVNNIKWEGKVPAVNTTLFAFIDNYTEYRDFQGAERNYVERGREEVENETCTINNVSFMGNANKSEDTGPSGLCCYKTENVNFTIDNCLSQSWFIAHFFEGNTLSGNGVTHTMKNCTAFDSYNSLLYCYGARNVIIEDSYLIGAGGPVMICDELNNEFDFNDDNDFDDDGEVKYSSSTNVKVSNSIMQSYIYGGEAWFNNYGAGSIVAGLQAMNQLLTPLNNTIVEKNKDNVSVVNIIAVFKDGKAASIQPCNISGTFTDVGVDDKGTEDIADDTSIYATGLALNSKEEDAIDAYKEQIQGQLVAQMGAAAAAELLAQMAVMQDFNGTIAVPGTEGYLVNPTGRYSTDKVFQPGYMNIHLFNGMAAVVGLK